MSTRHLMLSIAVVFTSLSSLAELPPAMKSGLMDLYYEANYFHSDTNIGDERTGNSTGETSSLPRGQSYENLTNSLEFGYTMEQGFRMAGGATFAYARSRGSTDDRTNTEIGYLIARGQYAIGTGNFVFVPDAKLAYSVPNSVNDTTFNDDEVMTNEAASHVQLGTWAIWTFWKMRTHAYLGYRFQDDDRANLGMWAWGLRFFTNTFWIDGELNGAIVMQNDGADSINASSRRGVTNTVNGGSLRYYAVDPDWIDGEVSAGFRISPGTKLSAGLGHTITGTNTAYGLSMFARLFMDFGDSYTEQTTSKRARQRRKRHRSLSRPRHFKPKLEEYDESLFEDEDAQVESEL